MKSSPRFRSLGIAQLGLGLLSFIFSCATAPDKPTELPSRNLPISLPYPEVEDTLAWDPDPIHDSDRAGSDTDSTHATLALGAIGWSSPPVSPDTTSAVTPPIPLPDGIRTQARPKDLADKIRVLLSREARALSVYSLGELQILSESVTLEPNPALRSWTATKLVTVRGAMLIRRQNLGFELSQNGKTLATTSSNRLRLISVNRFNLIDLNGSVYRGGMHLLGQNDGSILTINVLGVEDYLRGVLPYELGTVDRGSLEALKALAVVARTYAYKRMLHPGNRDFHVFSDVQDQVYKGVKGEYLLSDRAVWETRSMAVLYRDSLAQCYYFSTCGGHTASKHEVWGGESVPYLLSQSDLDEKGQAYCRISKYSSWTEDWNPLQLAGILKRNLKSAGVNDIPTFSRIKSLEVISRASCGRIRVLKINTDGGPILIKGDKVRWALRPSANERKILPSASFDVRMVDGQVTAEGRGFGHGVGLCQMGAIARAKANQSFKQIIDAYFTNVQLVEYR